MKTILKISSLFSALVLVLGLASCSGKKVSDAPVPMFCIGDSLEVQAMIEDYLNLVHQKDYEMAFTRLYSIKGGQVFAISEEEQEALMQQYYTFPVLRYKCESMDFVDEHNVTITYVIEFFDKDPDSNIPNTYKITFAPQRLNAEWFLCIKNEFYAY